MKLKDLLRILHQFDEDSNVHFSTKDTHFLDVDTILLGDPTQAPGSIRLALDDPANVKRRQRYAEFLKETFG